MAQCRSDWLADHIEHWPLERLTPYAANPRTHTPQQIDQIAASIKEFGFVNPILVSADGTIIAGHGRLEAARKLGMETVPVIVLDHLTDAQRRALVIADNRLAEMAMWDERQLLDELERLIDDGIDIDLTGFTQDDLPALDRDIQIEEVREWTERHTIRIVCESADEADRVRKALGMQQRAKSIRGSALLEAIGAHRAARRASQ